MATSNRRAFLQALGKRVARPARTTRSAAHEAAFPPTRRADPDEVFELIHSEGLGHREDDIAALIRPSVRLVAVPARAETSQAWTDPAAIGTGAPMIQIDRSAPQLLDTPLSGTGWCELAAEGDDRGDLVVHATVLDRRPEVGPMLPADLTTHLTLPPVWTPAVQDLGLAGYDHDAYVSLRARLADAQGLAAAGGEPMPDRQADWRLLAELATDGGVVCIWAADERLGRLSALIR